MTQLIAPSIAPATSSRISRVGSGMPTLEDAIRRILNLAAAGLPQMMRPDTRQFAFTRRKQPNGELRLEGTSIRYGAIVLLGIIHLPSERQREILGGETALEYFGRLLEMPNSSCNLGDAALIAWVAAEMRHADLSKALQDLRRCSDVMGNCHVVDLSWSLCALCAATDQVDVSRETRCFRDRLLGVFNPSTGVFPHEIDRSGKRWYRSHVGCFADQVYPIQALSRLHKTLGDEKALAAANRCAEQICRMQGPRGQWWWHYDTRTGNVIEGYPVYSVHQHAMAPMALFDLAEAGGRDFSDAIRLGLGWMICAPEIARSLIDDEHHVIWRKVARHEPRKFTRIVRTMVSGFSRNTRLRWMDYLFPPRAIDFECRPYELGWLLHAWHGGPK